MDADAGKETLCAGFNIPSVKRRSVLISWPRHNQAGSMMGIVSLVSLFGGRAKRTAARDEWLSPRSSEELLQTPYRQQLLAALWDLTSLPRAHFLRYVHAPITRYAELVQLLPASESHHHAYEGGMLDHGIEIVCYAARIRRQHLLPPGAKPEEQVSTSELWSVAVIFAALLHDAAKVLVDVDIVLESGRDWRLWRGPIPERYRVRYRPSREYYLHSAINPLLARQVIGSEGLDWMFSDPKLFAMLMYAISGHTERAGIIGEIVGQADRASVARAMGGDPARAFQAPEHSLQRKLAEGLRYLLKEKLALNERGGAAFLSDSAVWIVTPRVPRELKAHLIQHGVTGIPSEDTRLYDEMQAHGLIEANAAGRSVWKVRLAQDEWSATLSCLKLSPSLVWPDMETRPDPWQGTLEVVGEENETQSESPGESQVAMPLPASASPDLASGLDQEVMKESIDDELMDLITGPSLDDKVTTTSKASSEELEATRVDIPAAGGMKPQEEEGDEDNRGLGSEFLEWVKDGVSTHRLAVNATKAAIHGVDDKWLLVSPSIFRKFCATTPGMEDRWKEVQQQFQKLNLHLQRPDGTNIYSVRVVGPNKKGSVLKGYLMKDREMFREHRNNPHLSLIE